jgi:hypothetical protein
MNLGSQYDSRIIELLALAPQTATRLAKQLKVDDGTLAVHFGRERSSSRSGVRSSRRASNGSRP